VYSERIAFVDGRVSPAGESFDSIATLRYGKCALSFQSFHNGLRSLRTPTYQSQGKRDAPPHRERKPTMTPPDQRVVITVTDRHFVVCRRRELPQGSISYECARNADELEAEAMLVLARRGQPFMTGQEFTCPPELAKRARWN
jgi:hypothetical protein